MPLPSLSTSVLGAVPYHTFPDFQLGPLTIRTFGLLVALGIVLGAMLGARYVANRGLDPDEYISVATTACIVGLVGARLSWVLSHLEAIETPLDVIAVWDGGVQFSGGLLAGALAGWWLMRGKHDKAGGWVLVDASALGLVLGMAIGRLGCMAVGEHFGDTTTFALGMTYRGGGTVEPEPAIGTTFHNTAFYEFLHLLVLFAVIGLVLRRAGNRRDPLVPGTLGAIVLVWYGVGRFTTDIVRIYDSRAAGLTGAQWASLVMVAVGLWLLATGSRRAARLADEAVPADVKRPEPSGIRVIRSEGSETGPDAQVDDTATPDDGQVTTSATTSSADDLDRAHDAEPMSHVRVTPTDSEHEADDGIDSSHGDTAPDDRNA